MSAAGGSGTEPELSEVTRMDQSVPDPDFLAAGDDGAHAAQRLVALFVRPQRGVREGGHGAGEANGRPERRIGSGAAHSACSAIATLAPRRH